MLLHDLGQLELRQKSDSDMGKMKKAQSHFEESLTIAQAHNHRERIVQAQLALGDVYWRVGEAVAAERAFTAALTHAHQTRNVADQTLATYGLAQLAHNIPQAEECYEKLNKMGHYRAKSVGVWLRQNGSKG